MPVVLYQAMDLRFDYLQTTPIVGVHTALLQMPSQPSRPTNKVVEILRKRGRQICLLEYLRDALSSYGLHQWNPVLISKNFPYSRRRSTLLGKFHYKRLDLFGAIIAPVGRSLRDRTIRLRFPSFMSMYSCQRSAPKLFITRGGTVFKDCRIRLAVRELVWNYLLDKYHSANLRVALDL